MCVNWTLRDRVQCTSQRLANSSWQGVREGHCLISLFTAVCLPDQLVCRLSPLGGSTYHKVSCPVLIAVYVSRILVKLDMPWKRRAIFSIVCWAFTTKVGVSFVYHMDDDTSEVDSFSRECYQALSSPVFLGESLGTRLGGGGGGGGAVSSIQA